jgi:UDP-GlcNAc:undecaprenyl-phosphate GlcNAc-1-phosphate transferase
MLPLILGFSAAILSLLLTPLFRDLALRRGWVDKPDQTRKLHSAPVPRIGGVPIVLAYAGSFAVLLLFGLHGDAGMQLPMPLLWNLLPAALIVFATGLLDDFVGLAPIHKLAGLGAAAGLACLSGLRIDRLAGYDIGVLGIPLAMIWLVGCANAFNLIDGVDGLASGVGLLATLTMMAAGVLHGDAGLAILTAPLAGALIGFLRCNFNPASIFLGDCGSLLAGFMLGCCGVIWSQKSATLLGMTAPLMALSLPLIDTALSIARRYLGRRPIFGADHGHIHHRLLDRGLTPRRVTLLLYGVSAIGACLALLQSAAESDGGRFIIALFCVAVWMGVRHLGYLEFRIAARLVRESDFRSMIHSHMSLRGYEESLRAASSPEECWNAILKGAREFGFSHAALHLGGRSFSEQIEEGMQRHWISHVPLSELEYVQLARAFNLGTPPSVVARFVDLLHSGLSHKALEFRLAAAAKPRLPQVDAAAEPAAVRR